MSNTIHTAGVILAGGQGSRMGPLTKSRAKPALPYGTKYRLIDFVLSNLTNSHVYDITVLLQQNPDSITDHLIDTWIPRMGSIGQLRTAHPTHQSAQEEKYSGTANAVYQNWKKITFPKKRPAADLVAIFGADHIYKHDIRPFLNLHLKRKSDFTICATRVPVEVAAKDLGVLVVDKSGKVLRFEEKPAKPTEIPDDKGYCLASMGNYIMPAGLGGEILEDDHSNPKSGHDFGRDIIPSIINDHNVYAYTFESHIAEGEVQSYWVDVGTIENYLNACTRLTHPSPDINLHNKKWAIATGPTEKLAPYKDVEMGFIVAGATIRNRGVTFKETVLHREVTIWDFANLERCVVFDGVEILAGAKIKNTIIDENNIIPEGIEIGFNKDEDESNGLFVKPIADGGWITIVPENHVFS